MPPRPIVLTIRYGPMWAGGGTASAARVRTASAPCPAVSSGCGRGVSGERRPVPWVVGSSPVIPGLRASPDYMVAPPRTLTLKPRGTASPATGQGPPPRRVGRIRRPAGRPRPLLRLAAHARRPAGLPGPGEARGRVAEPEPHERI